MENHETFKMTYSAEQQAEIDNIRRKYVPQEPDKMERLRALDAAVSKKAVGVSIFAGLAGAIVMGIGMSLVMSEFGALLGVVKYPVGIVIGAAGMVLLSCAYPLYVRTLKKEREKAAPEILRLSEELLK